MNKKVALILHNQFEEGEAVITIDVLRRGGIVVDVFTLNHTLETTGSHNITIKAEFLFEKLSVDNYDGIIIPGGPGADNLLDHQQFHNMIIKFNQNNKMIAAVCGAPQILGAAGVIDDVKIVKHPNTNQYINLDLVQKENVCTDKNIITGVSVGTTIWFALEIIKYLIDDKKAVEIKNQLVIF